MTAQRLALTGGYPDGVWSCAWCAAELADGGIAHREDCRWIADIRDAPCCDLHGRNCELPSELCCEGCTEADHPAHRKRGPCSNPVLSPNTLGEAARMAAAVAAERERLAQAAGELKFRLYRPGNGPGAGTQALDVVPLTGLLALLREQP